jgi:hypothetical protein
MTSEYPSTTTASAASGPDTSSTWKLLRLRVTADGDPSVLPRLLGLLQNLNFTPRSVRAEFGMNALMYLQIDIAGLSEERVNLIASKIGENPCVLNSYWHFV